MEVREVNMADPLQPDIVVLGDVALDSSATLPISFPSLNRQEGHRGRIDEALGGAGFNFAKQAKRVGFRPLLICAVGGDVTGRIIELLLHALDFDARPLHKPNAATGRGVILWDAKRTRLMIFNHPNANDEITEDDIEKYTRALLKCKAIYVTGYCIADRQTPRAAAVRKVVRLARTDPSIRVILDLVPHDLQKIYRNFDELNTAASGIDILISEVATVRRMLDLGTRNEVVTAEMATETANFLARRFPTFILRFGPDGSNNQLIWDRGKLTCEPTGYPNVEQKIGFGDILAAEALWHILGREG
jgi:sugar/nucleoside kinase (ribokinase family)